MKYLGVDLGIKRIGLARSEGDLASPWKVIETKKLSESIGKIKEAARDFDKVIVGVPEGKMGKIAKKIIEKLKENGLDVVAADETLSTQHATKLMVELDLSKKKRKVNDAYSASEILQNYLDQK